MKTTILAGIAAAVMTATPALCRDRHDLALVELSRVVDGDTIELQGGEKIRLLAIDAPETWKPHCDRELDIGMQASDRLRDMLTGSITVKRFGFDRYGRTLAMVYTDGVDVGRMLINEQLALPYQPGSAAKLSRLQYWCGPAARLEY